MTHPKLRNLSMAVLEDEGDIVFLRRVQEGPAAGSYGIHVAKLAGIPDAVLVRARDLQTRLAQAERNFHEDASHPDTVTRVSQVASGKGTHAATLNGELFGSDELVLSRLRGLDTDRLTPLQALALLAELRGQLESRN
jgi:DNA mismatch repair protein MutS